MSETIPLFPLGTVLYPGLLLPLHVFEERYRQLVRDLLESKELMRFGVVAIREGRETGADGIKALYQVGCTAMVRRVNEHDDGSFDLITVGERRFRLGRLDTSAPYLRAAVDFLAEDAGEEIAAGRAVREVREAFVAYLEALSARGVSQADVPELPQDPVPLSYLVAASVVADLPDKQALLAAPDAVRRLGAERALLARETAMLRALTAAPAPDFRYRPYSSN
jgi:Lon protease-like protein